MNVNNNKIMLIVVCQLFMLDNNLTKITVLIQIPRFLTIIIMK